MFQLLFWPLFCATIATAQGLILPAIRRTPLGSPEAARQAFALHVLFALAYFLPCWLCPATIPFWKWLLVGFATRVVLFDALLNYAAGDAMLAVGQTAASDRLLQKLSPTHPERVSGLLKTAVLAATLLLLFLHY